MSSQLCKHQSFFSIFLLLCKLESEEPVKQSLMPWKWLFDLLPTICIFLFSRESTTYLLIVHMWYINAKKIGSVSFGCYLTLVCVWFSGYTLSYVYIWGALHWRAHIPVPKRCAYIYRGWSPCQAAKVLFGSFSIRFLVNLQFWFL